MMESTTYFQNLLASRKPAKHPNNFEVIDYSMQMKNIHIIVIRIGYKENWHD
jgi:hypothetical protein